VALLTAASTATSSTRTFGEGRDRGRSTVEHTLAPGYDGYPSVVRAGPVRGSGVPRVRGLENRSGRRKMSGPTRRETGDTMLIASLLRAKGTFVATIDADLRVSDLLGELARHNVGALVVSADGHTVDGVVSERDVVRHLHRMGARVLEMPVSSLMTRDVLTCSTSDTVDEIMLTMTSSRVRHVPVVDQHGLVGIVSIGDLVKSRLDELQGERDDLISYISR
jgi:CBS domain-containing protein